MKKDKELADRKKEKEKGKKKEIGYIAIKAFEMAKLDSLSLCIHMLLTYIF